jgi:hypothetical protein
MKTFLSFAVLLSIFFTAVRAGAQTNTEPINQPSGVFAIAERGANHRLWQRVTLHTNQLGNVRSITNSFTELETGLHYQGNGQWLESEAKIEITPEGASAVKGQHKVSFEGNINSVGAIDLTTPDGKRMRSHVLGLSYFDTATGNSALIAEIKDSVGLLAPPNRVLYPDAFQDIKADIRYTYSKSGFEQDVILREQPPSPTEYGLTVESTRLEVLTEFVEAPEPVKTQTLLNDGTADQRLDFGLMKIGKGVAFLMGDNNTPTNNLQGAATPVGKKWTQMEGRTFLIESVSYNSIKSHLETLPPMQANAAQGKADKVARLSKATKNRKLPIKREARAEKQEMRVASIENNKPGFLLDYILVGGTTDYTFKGDTTYLVNGAVEIYGTITLEGGTVIKFTSTNSAEIQALDGLFDCKTSSYRPAVFTSRNDNSVGEVLPGSTGNPTNYVGMAVATGSPTLSHLRFSYADWPMSAWDTASHIKLNDVQYVKCAVPVNLEGGTATLRNVLMIQSVVPLRGNTNYTVHAENVTIDGADPFGMTGPGSATVNFTNSIVVAVTNLGDDVIVVTNNSLIDTNIISGLFQTVGAASYYLADQSPYRDIGTTNINSTLLAGLRKKTTYPPVVLSNVVYTNDLTMFPQAQRDTNTPDFGYHYDPLDYVLGGFFVTNATISITPGTAVGTFSSINTYGFSIQKGAAITSEGEPTHLNYIVNYNTVQEQSNTNWTKVNPISFYSSWTSGSPAATASFRFTVWSMLGSDSQHFYASSADMPAISFRDCQIFSGALYSEGPAFYMTNSLLFRVYTSVASDTEFILQNNTFYGGQFDFVNWNANSFFKDNLFAYTTNNQIVYDVTNDFNAFYNSSNITPAGASNVVLTNLTFETGPLGDFYLSTNNVQLLNSGSTNANLLTLYHFTTATNQVKETNSIVDRGFHYVAVTNGVPIDSDSDGVPDYLEDANGNGSVNSGETNWEDAFDLGLRVIITRPAANSVIP